MVWGKSYKDCWKNFYLGLKKFLILLALGIAIYILYIYMIKKERGNNGK